MKKKKILKDFQIDCLKKYGNTIISKKHELEDIQEEGLKYGLSLKVREFKTRIDNTHYVLEVE